jgi:hypothetical protein
MRKTGCQTPYSRAIGVRASGSRAHLRAFGNRTPIKYVNVIQNILNHVGHAPSVGRSIMPDAEAGDLQPAVLAYCDGLLLRTHREVPPA